ncbi:MAG: S8 family serine peptidase, partial [Nitrosopumilus sp.]|nr:S8 family serine peptidase [Nitrosopumilus sp.]
MAAGTALNGDGVLVSVLDSSISHDSAFGSRMIQRADCRPEGCLAVGQISTDELKNATHGTRVAQIIGSELSAHGGIAPGVDFLSIDIGYDKLTNAHIAQALDWSLRSGVDVVNLSAGVPTLKTAPPGDRIHTAELIMNEAVDKGMVVVAAAGNDGNKYFIDDSGAVDSYLVYGNFSLQAVARNVITVGAVNGDASASQPTSTNGPTLDTRILKPEIVAPTDVLLYRYNQGSAVLEHTRGGTSFAAPQVSATAALMLQARPDLTPAQVKAALLLGATWKGPVPCSSAQYEMEDAQDDCSYAKTPIDDEFAKTSQSLGLLNNAGLGVLNTVASLGYITGEADHVLTGHLGLGKTREHFEFNVTDTSETVKVILVWHVHPHGSINDQIGRESEPDAKNLGFTIEGPDRSPIPVMTGTSRSQPTEFVVFKPNVAGTYVISVGGGDLDDLPKPIQTFAIASTSPIAPVKSPSVHTKLDNTPPVADPQTVLFTVTTPRVIRLTASDADGDAVTFHVSDKPARGTVSTDELINGTVSRLVYTPDPGSALADGFTVVPHDGRDAGAPVRISLEPESLPPNTEPFGIAADDLAEMDVLIVDSDYKHGRYEQAFERSISSVSGIRVGSENMEGAEITIHTPGGDVFRVVATDDPRDLQFNPPIDVSSVTLSAAGIVEEEVYKKATGKRAGDARVFVGYKADESCVREFSGGGPLSCPARFSRTFTADAGRQIPDFTGSRPLPVPIVVTEQGTLKDISVTVDISHRVPSQLEISLTPPEGERIVLHNRIPVSGTGISATYTVAHPALRSLLGEYVKGIWLAEVHDRARGTSGTFNSWELEIEYEPPHPPEIPPSTPQRDIVADDFGSDLRKWKEEGGTNWSVGSRATRNLVEPGLPNDPILKASSCRQACTISLKDAVDLTPYSDAGLWFSRNVDPAIGSNGYLRVQAYDGTGWTTIADWTHNRGDDGRWHKEYYNLADYLDVDDFNVRFVTHQGRSNEVVAINDFRITTGDGAVAPAPKKIDFTAELGGDRSLIVLRFTKPVIESFAASDFELSHGKVDSVTNFASSKTRHLTVSGIPYDVQVKVTYSPRLQRLSADATPGLASGASSSTNAVFNPDPSAARGSVAISDDFESGTGSWSLERYGRIRSVVPATEPGAAIPGLPADNSAMRLYTCYHGCLAQPEGSVDATSPLIVGFDRYVERHSKDDRINVEYSTDSGSTWKVAASFREADGALAGTWVRESVMLDATASVTHLRLAIYVKSGSTYIDNFSVRSIPTSAVPDTATTHAFQFHGGLPSWTLTGDYETLWTAGAPAAAVDGQTAADRAMIASDCDRYCYAQLGYALDASAPLLVSLDKYVDRSASRLDGLYVQYSTDGGTSWTNLAEYTGNTDDDDSTWSREVLSLGAQGGEALLRLAAYSLNDREKVEVDNLVIQQKPPDPASLPAVTLKASLDEANEVMTVVLSTGLYKTFKASDFALDAGSVDSLEHSPGSDTVVLGVSGVPPGREVTVSYTGAPHIVGLNHGAELRRSESATVLSSTPDSPPVIVSISNTTFRSDHWGSIYVQASDPDGDEISFTLVDSPYYIRSSSIVHQDRLALNVGPRHNHVGTDDVSVLVSAGGATTWANFTVTVLDGTPPVFQYIPPSLTFKSVHLLTPVHFNLPRALDYVDWHYTAPGSSKNSKVTSSPQPGDLFPRGTTNVNLTATDKSGNMETAVMAIIVTNRDMDPITGLSFSSTSNTTRITWDAHASINPPYKVKLYPEGSYGKRIVFVQDGTSLTFVGLDPDTRYVASVQLPNHKNTRAEGSFHTSQGSGHAETSISGGKVPPVTLLRSETRDVRLVFDAPGDPKIRLLDRRDLVSLDDLGNGTAILTIDPDRQRGKYRILVAATYGDESLISPVDVVIKNKRVVRGGSVQEAPPPGAAWPGAGNGSAQEASPIGVAAPDTTPDTTPPSIRVGSASEHPYGVPYEDPGATCTDDRDPEKTVYSDGVIDARSPGPQALRYTCADAAGNEAQPKTRIVVV